MCIVFSLASILKDHHLEGSATSPNQSLAYGVLVSVIAVAIGSLQFLKDEDLIQESRVLPHIERGPGAPQLEHARHSRHPLCTAFSC